MQLIRDACFLVLALTLGACQHNSPGSPQTASAPPAATPAAQTPTASVENDPQSDALYHYMRGVAAELDAMMSRTEETSLAELRRSTDEFENVVKLGFSPASVRMNLARTLRFLASRTSDPQGRHELYLRAQGHYEAAIFEGNNRDEAIDGYLAIEQEVFQSPPARVVEKLRALIQRDPNQLALWSRLGDLFVQLGRSEDARKVFEDLSAARPEDSQVWIQRGRAEYAAQKYQDALVSFDNAIRFRRNDEEMFEAMRQQILCNYGLGRLDEALDLLQQLVTRQPAQAENWVHMAEYHLLAKDYPEALKAVDQAVSIDQKNFYAGVLRGQILTAAGKPDEGLGEFQKLTRLWPRRPESWRLLGDAQFEQRRYQDAASSLEQAMKLDPQHTPTRFSLAEAYRLAGRLKEAEEALGHLDADIQKNPAVVRSMFFLKLEVEDFPGAYALAARTMELEPKNALSHYMMGAVLERMGRLDEAVIQLKKSISLKPDFATARNYLGYLLADHGVHLPEAMVQIRVALSLDPGNGAFLDSLGWAYFKAGELDTALKFLTSATEALEKAGTPESLVLEHLGDALYGLQCYGRAASTWKQALAIEKGDLRRGLLEGKVKEVEALPAQADACRSPATVSPKSAAR